MSAPNGLNGTTTVEIYHNEKKNGIEIDFKGNTPVKVVRDWLKRNCFQFSRSTKVWYIPYTADRYDNILFIFQNRSFETEDIKQKPTPKKPVATKKQQPSNKTATEKKPIATKQQQKSNDSATKQQSSNKIATETTTPTPTAREYDKKQPSKSVKKEVELEIHETTHSKKGHNLFVAKIIGRVEKPTFTKLLKKAKSLGGYYSGYAKDGAIPGFQFLEKEKLNQFLDTKVEVAQDDDETAPVGALPLFQHIASYQIMKEVAKQHRENHNLQEKHKPKAYLTHKGNIVINFFRTDQWTVSTVYDIYKKISKTGSATDFYLKDQKRILYKYPEFKENLMKEEIDGKDWYYRIDGRYFSPIVQQTLTQRTKFMDLLKEKGFEILGTAQVMYGSKRIYFRKDTAPTQENTESNQDLWKEIEIGSKVFVPKNKRKPHYDLSNQNQTIKRDVLEREVLLGKMEIAQVEQFNSYEDYYEAVKNPVFVHTNEFDFSSHYSPRIGKDVVLYDKHSFRYKGNAKAYIDLDNPFKETTSKPKEQDPQKLAEKFIKVADSFFDAHDKAKQQLKTQKRNTPKRNREWNSKNVHADIDYDRYLYYKAIGDALLDNKLPEILKRINPIKKTGHVDLFIKHIDNSGGYYEAYRSQKPFFEVYSDQALKRGKEIGLDSMTKIKEAYEVLNKLVGSDIENNEEKEKKAKINQLEDEWRFTKQEGFFPTPKTLTKDLVKKADIISSHTVLEPSAGLGHIAEIIKEKHPKATLHVIEKWNSLQEILRLKGFEVVGSDFLKYSEQKYDRIVMNPPFEKYQDIDHVQHAFNLLKAGGRLVAIVGAGAMQNSQKKAKAFQNFVNENGYAVQNSENSFKSAFRSTEVNTYTVVLDKDDDKKKDDPKPSKVTVESFPVMDIYTNPKFQNRGADYSQESVDRIINAVKNGSFNWSVFDPVLLWKHPKDKKTYVLSGHSRTRAFQLLAMTKKEFTHIPSKIVNVSEKEATRIALESNTLSTKETNLERAFYYQKLRAEGKDKKEVQTIARQNEGKNTKAILNLSYLNPNGYMVDTLKALESSDTTNKTSVEIIADWIGEAKEKFTQLTNSHETELAKWLIEKAYGTKAGQFSNKKAFFERLNVAIQRKTEFGKFSTSTPLNMEKSIFKNNIEQQFDEETQELKKKVAELEKQLKQQSEHAHTLLKEKKTTQEQVNNVIADHASQFARAKSQLNQHINKKNDVLQASKQQTALFGTKKLMSAKELSKMKFQEYEFTGKYLELMGKPSEGFRMMLHGSPGGGKTTFLLQFSKYLCNNFGSVLYVSKEEYGSSTLTQKVNKYLTPIPHNIDFAEDVKNIDLNKYNFVILDSINDMKMDLKGFKELKAQYPKVAFILILQCTKSGQFKGGKEWEHEVEIGAEITEPGTISIYKNRFDVKGELYFFD